ARDEALQLLVLAQLGRNRVERAGEIVRDGQDIAREGRGGVGARVGQLLLQAPADILRLGQRVERLLLGGGQLVLQRGDTRGGILAGLLGRGSRRAALGHIGRQCLVLVLGLFS